MKWYERRVNLETDTRGIEESEREVFELEDTDVNPIGCISGKCHILKCRGYEEVRGSSPTHASLLPGMAAVLLDASARLIEQGGGGVEFIFLDHHHHDYVLLSRHVVLSTS